MFVYTFYVWLRKTRHGLLETQRKRACMVALTILSLIFLQSGHQTVAIGTWLEATEMAASNVRTLAARLTRPTSAALQ
ncbi:MAG: hypothetical protein ACM3SS_00135 [Rhodospirillaceae bacterium]